MYLQGTTKKFAYLERDKQNKHFWFVISDRNRFRKIWSGVEHGLLIYTAIYVPFQVSFITDDKSVPVFIERVDDVVDVLFILQLFLTFLFSFEKPNGS